MQCSERCLRFGIKQGKYSSGKVRCPHCEIWFEPHIVRHCNDGYTRKCICCDRTLRTRPRESKARTRLMNTVYWNTDVSTIMQEVITWHVREFAQGTGHWNSISSISDMQTVRKDAKYVVCSYSGKDCGVRAVAIG